MVLSHTLLIMYNEREHTTGSDRIFSHLTFSTISYTTRKIFNSCFVTWYTLKLDTVYPINYFSTENCKPLLGTKFFSKIYSLWCCKRIVEIVALGSLWWTKFHFFHVNDWTHHMMRLREEHIILLQIPKACFNTPKRAKGSSIIPLSTVYLSTRLYRVP